MRTFPYMYTSKYEVLHQLYCVNGNGYEWYKGKITPKYKMNHSGYEITKRQAEVLYKYNNKLPGYIYPLCEFSIINNIPDDIKSDYLDGAKLTYDMIKEVHDHMKWTLSYDGQLKNPKLYGEEYLPKIHRKLYGTN